MMARGCRVGLGVVAMALATSGTSSANAEATLSMYGSPVAYTYVSPRDRAEDGTYEFIYVGVYITARQRAAFR